METTQGTYIYMYHIITIDTGTRNVVDENKQKFHIFKNESIVRRSSALYIRYYVMYRLSLYNVWVYKTERILGDNIIVISSIKNF